MNTLDLSPAVSVFIALLVSVAGLYLLRIPQSARILSQSFTALSRAQERQIQQLQKDLRDLRTLHEECEERSDKLERRIYQLEGRRL